MQTTGAALRERERPIAWRRGGILLGILAVHGFVVLALILARIVEMPTVPVAQETMLILTPIERPSAQRKRSTRTNRSQSDAALPDYHWVGPGGAGVGNAVRIIRIPQYRAEGPPHCSKILRPGTAEWQRLCGSQTAGDADEGKDIAQLRLNPLRWRRWEDERRARNKPIVVPCGYIHTFPPDGGPPPPPVRMVDVGCAAKELFGH